MYQYTQFDTDFVASRLVQFRDQVERRLDGRLSEDEFKQLRLMNGVYLQLHAYMLRVAIPYGTLNSTQMRALADVGERWDRGYGHFTTRQNIQFNWPSLIDIPDMLECLAAANMHAIQTSGNTIRNVTADHFAGAAADEIEDPRPVAELIRQWSTDHPEFQFMPRKFKIAVSGSPNDRAVIRAHDIGLEAVRRGDEIGYRMFVGGGLGRTPMIGKVLFDFVPLGDLLPTLEATVHVWNLIGRRDNKYKARIKILVHEYGLENLRADVEAAREAIRQEFDDTALASLDDIRRQFAAPEYMSASLEGYQTELEKYGDFRAFVETNTSRHKNTDYAILQISTKPIGGIPGDVTSDQMRVIADLAECYAHDEIRISHEQNIVFPHVHKVDLYSIYQGLRAIGLATANIGQISDIIACPGLDYCALATARSIPIAQQISLHFDAIGLGEEIGEFKIKISGCINACGHHHVGHVGILGLDRAGVENYQITLGGDATENIALGAKTGPGFSADALIPALERLVRRYLELRDDENDRFIDVFGRLGADPFKDALYAEQQ